MSKDSTATPPAAIADAVLEAIRGERFYILPHPELKPAIEVRLQNIAGERNPSALS